MSHKTQTNYRWKQISQTAPPENVFLHTKIDDKDGERNIQPMKKQGNLWFVMDGTYVYYRPTHWAFITDDF